MGSIDRPLNREGRTQAANVAEELSNICIDKIYSSPLARAYETSKLIAEKQKKLPEIIILTDLRERCFGELEGKVKVRMARGDLACYSGVESEEDFVGRIEHSMESIHNDGVTLIVSHSAVFRCLVEKLGYSTRPSLVRIMNCQIVQLDR
ncbi:broad specificity phosphatase PhoE [Pseudomonas sp. PvP009]|jgi:broad specificity phosphatase PhoE|nr:broad specificity phosphatase PhoE [Pseudomonas sp. PvP009]